MNEFIIIGLSAVIFIPIGMLTMIVIFNLPSKSKYVAVKCCVNCYKSLTHREEFYSDGVCPHCGHISNSTICDTKTKSVKVGD